MHGLINRTIETFLRSTYGVETAETILAEAGAPEEGFESMRDYEAQLTIAVLRAATRHTGAPRDSLLEDIGTFLVWHPGFWPVRRLLRFSGASFEEFLEAFDDLPARVRMAIPELELPGLEVERESQTDFAVAVSPPRGYGALLSGVIRAMADDYGSLATIDRGPAEAGGELLRVRLHDARFSEGRAFSLSRKRIAGA